MPVIDNRRMKTAYLLSLTVLLSLLVACGPDQSGDVTVVVVPGQEPTAPVDTNAATPIPPSPTPDIPPEIALQIADRDLLDGYYERAVFAYQALLMREDAPTDIRAEAAYGMGQAALREGLFQDAVDAMTALITAFPQDARIPHAYFLRGDAYLGLSQWQAAIDDFQQYLVLRPGLIDSYTYERIGDAQLALNQYPAALESYNQATDANRTLATLLALREKVARLHSLNGQINQAIVQYDAILDVAENTPYRAEIEFMAAEAVLNAGDNEAALARMQRIFENYPAQPQAYEAMRVLLDNGRSLDSYTQGQVAYFNEDYEGAIEAFNRYSSEVNVGEIPAELHLYLGRSYRALGNSQAALVAFQTIVDQHSTDPLFGEALLERGRTAFLAGDNETAIQRYLSIADNYGYLGEPAAQALWRAGYLYGTNGDLAKSQQVFLRLADSYPSTEDAESGLFIAAAQALSASDTATAESLYNRVAAMTSGADQASAYLQVGRLALERGDQAGANQAFSQVVAAAPDTYYSARASDILAGIEPFTPPAQYVWQSDDAVDVPAAEDWLRTTFGIQQEGPLWPLSPTLEVDPRLQRGRELWAVGAIDAAENEFVDVLRDYSQDGLASYQLGVFFRVLGSYYPSQQGAANVIEASGISDLDAPRYIAQMRYPVYYRDEILRICNQYGIDPLLLLSLIRLESLFDTYATAAAGEKGLTQVIPSTGQYIADQLNWPDYQHRDLFRPYAGIEFGAYYLSEQLALFDDKTYPALAAYNGGPGRAINWLELSGDNPDAFMSTITIESVQRYIQIAYRNYNIYRALYGAQ